MHTLTPDLADRMARTAIDNIGREYPNAPALFLRTADDLKPPRIVHPAFFGSWDWHSSVHQHWLLARLLRLGILRHSADDARAAVAGSLTEDNLDVEAAYLRQRPSFERTYGWAWVLALADELRAMSERVPEADAWCRAIASLAATVRELWMDHLPAALYPIRAGTHANSAFALRFAIRHARRTGVVAFEQALADKALAWFADDAAYPVHLEPGGDDFLSPALVEAALMADLLGPQEWGEWLARFLPGDLTAITRPVTVVERSDPKLAHLDGLNLSRAWSWRLLAGRDVPGAAAAADRHLDAALPGLFSGEYAAEHWVTTFALLALAEDDDPIGVSRESRATVEDPS